jgi:calpain
MGCVNSIKGKKVKNADTGPHGILENSYYGIIDVREVYYNQLN